MSRRLRRSTTAGIVAGLGVVLIAAVGLGTRAEPLLLLRADTASAVVDVGSGETLRVVADSVPSVDGQTLVAADTHLGSTSLTAIRTGTGQERWSRTLDGELAVRLVDHTGETVVLGPSDGADTYAPVGRTRTELAVSGPDGTRYFDLEGNVEPEALSTDRRSLFVISYQPPEAPDRYQVRRLDLDTGELGEVFTPDEELQTEMGGTARTQTWAPDGRRLYTLYTHEVAGERRAFVHVLDTDEVWAHCIDLPPHLQGLDEAATSLAVSPDGSRLYVTDHAVGRVAAVDTDSLTVERTTAIPGEVVGGPAHAHVTPTGDLVLAAGAHVAVLATDTLAPRDSWYVGGGVVGTATHGDSVLVVHESARIQQFAVGQGRLGQQNVAGLEVVRAVGTTSVRVASADAVKCAC